MLQVFCLVLGPWLLGPQEPVTPPQAQPVTPALSPDDEGLGLLRAAAEKQTNSKDLTVSSFYADMLLLDRRQMDQDVQLEIKFETFQTKDGEERDRIQTELHTAKGSLILSFDGRRYWRNTRGSWEQISKFAESERNDREELERRARLCHTLTQVFSLRVMADRLKNVTLAQRNVPDVDADGEPMTWAFELRALSADIGQLFPEPETAAEQPPLLPALPGEEFAPATEAMDARRLAEVRLFFDEDKILGRLDVRPQSTKGVVHDWESIYFSAQKSEAPKGDQSYRRVRIPMMAQIYDRPRQKDMKETFRINLREVQLNRRFDDLDFQPKLR